MLFNSLYQNICQIISKFSHKADIFCYEKTFRFTASTGMSWPVHKRKAWAPCHISMPSPPTARHPRSAAAVRSRVCRGVVNQISHGHPRPQDGRIRHHAGLGMGRHAQFGAVDQDGRVLQLPGKGGTVGQGRARAAQSVWSQIDAATSAAFSSDRLTMTISPRPSSAAWTATARAAPPAPQMTIFFSGKGHALFPQHGHEARAVGDVSREPSIVIDHGIHRTDDPGRRGQLIT